MVPISKGDCPEYISTDTLKMLLETTIYQTCVYLEYKYGIIPTLDDMNRIGQSIAKNADECFKYTFD